MSSSEIILNSKTFEPIIYCDSNNRKRLWNIKVELIQDLLSTFSKITMSYGIENGKTTISENIISEGKNMLKSNKTSHFEQAIKEAQSKWTKKKKSIDTFIVENEAKPPSVNSVDDVEFKRDLYTPIFPMLAQDFHKHKSKITFPVYIQPKLDGNRCIWNGTNLYSRTGKEWTSLNNTNLLKELRLHFKEYVFDGELYIHNSKFEDLGILRKKKITIEDSRILNNIEYHIYDIVDITKTFSQRLSLLENLFKNTSFTNLIFVKTYSANSFDEIASFHSDFIQDNYEGTMIRSNSLYQLNTRSYSLLKYKDFQDSEFLIVDFTHELNHHSPLQKLIIWICKTESGDLFNVRPQGTADERHYLYNNSSKYIGSKLWCKYFELSSDNKIPRFPSTKSNSYKTYIRNVID